MQEMQGMQAGAPAAGAPGGGVRFGDLPLGAHFWWDGRLYQKRPLAGWVTPTIRLNAVEPHGHAGAFLPDDTLVQPTPAWFMPDNVVPALPRWGGGNA